MTAQLCSVRTGDVTNGRTQVFFSDLMVSYFCVVILYRNLAMDSNKKLKLIVHVLIGYNQEH